MQHAVFLPLFDELAEPWAATRLAVEAEALGWDGFFVWDHIAYRSPVVALADPWLMLAVIASTTTAIRLGPMVTPLPRRRPAKVARETATLDRLSRGRLTLGVGIGGDGSGELSSTGEQEDERVRGEMLDESLEVLAKAWSGQPMQHRGKHYRVDGPSFQPTPRQQPGPPIWVAARYGNRAPLARAARFDGVFPIGIDEPAQLAEVVETVGRGAGFDVAIGVDPGQDPRPYAQVGATWALTALPITTTEDTALGVVRAGPPR